MKVPLLAAGAVCAVSMLAVQGAQAAPRVSLSMEHPDDELRRFETQLRAELLAMGLDVLSLAGAGDSSEIRAGSTAVIRIGRAEGAVVAQVWVRDRKTSQPVLKTIRPDPSAAADPSILALRTAELLRAILLESGPARPEEPEEPAHAAPRPAAPAATPKPPPLRWGLLAGISFVGGPGGIPMSIAPTLSAAWYPASLVGLELTGTGPILSSIRGPQGSAGVRQELAAARVRFAFLDAEHVAAPYVVAGLGAHHLKATGSAAGAYVGMSSDAWTWLGAAGFGLRLRFQRNVTIDLEGDCLVTGARQSVVFDDTTAASAGRPLFSATAGVGMQW